MKLDLVLENTRNKYAMDLLEESELSERETLNGKLIINESTMQVREMLVEGGLLQGVKDILEESWSIALFEESAAYDAYFKNMLKECKYDSVDDMPEAAKKAFFNKVDAGWNTDSEAGKDGKKNK